MVGIQPETEEEQNDPAFDPFKNQIVSFEYEQYIVSDRAANDAERQNALIQQQQERQLQSLRQDERFLNAQQRRQAGNNLEGVEGLVQGENAMSFIAQQESMLRAFKEGHLSSFKQNQRPLELMEQEECTICITDLVAPCQVSVLACNNNHVFHTECINMWIDKNKKDNEKKRPQNRLPPTCPICRKVIVESRIQEYLYKGVIGQDKKIGKPGENGKKKAQEVEMGQVEAEQVFHVPSGSAAQIDVLSIRASIQPTGEVAPRESDVAPRASEDAPRESTRALVGSTLPSITQGTRSLQQNGVNQE